MVFILLFIVVIVNLAGLQPPRKYRRLEPFCVKIWKILKLNKIQMHFLKNIKQNYTFKQGSLKSFNPLAHSISIGDRGVLLAR